jgi:uncharacterized protein (DUF1015 family)
MGCGGQVPPSPKPHFKQTGTTLSNEKDVCNNIFSEERMAFVKPFRGIVYNKDKIARIEAVVAPPYDVISLAMQDELYAASPYNIVRAEFGKGFQGDDRHHNKYTRARGFLSKWLKEGILIPDPKSAMYIYAQEYREDGLRKSRVGFISLMKLEDFAKKGVLPHERTFKEPKADRFRLICETRFNLSPIFSLYKDKGGLTRRILLSECDRVPPFIALHADNVAHKVWRLTDEKRIRSVQSAMRDRAIFIADGHHRYEVALQFRERMRRRFRGKPGAYDYVMMYFADMDPRGMTILSAHRMIKDIGSLARGDVAAMLKRHFTVKRLGSAKGLIAWLKRAKTLSGQFGLYIGGDAYVMKLKHVSYVDEMDIEDRSREWKTLDVSILHHLILRKILKVSDAEGNVVYTRDPEEAIQEVDRGNYTLAFLLNPTKISQVESIARNKELMPHKSTYFYPKLLSGLVLNKLD